jgi:hypothetical protein
VTAVLRPQPPGAAPVPAERRAPAPPAVDVSVLVPAKDEAENLPRFLELADLAFAADPRVRYEVVVVDDGSVDGTWPLLAQLQERYPWLRAARHRARRGIADALRTGYLNARGDVLVFYPADLQFMPEDIPRLAAPILAGESDMVTGYKLGQYEKAFVSRIYNGLRRRCSTSGARPQQRQGVPPRDHGGSAGPPDWHRYMIVLARRRGTRSPRSRCRSTRATPAARSSASAASRWACSTCSPCGSSFASAASRSCSFGMLGAALFALGVLAAASRSLWLRSPARRARGWTLIQTCLLLGGVFLVGGLVGELIAGQRAELAELRRELEEARARR